MNNKVESEKVLWQGSGIATEKNFDAMHHLDATVQIILQKWETVGSKNATDDHVTCTYI